MLSFYLEECYLILKLCRVYDVVIDVEFSPFLRTKGKDTKY